MPRKYAKGTRAWFICGRCGQRGLYRNSVFDGYYPNMRVHSECYEGRHPQEQLKKLDDPVALFRAQPEGFGPYGDGNNDGGNGSGGNLIVPVLTAQSGVTTDLSNMITWTPGEARGGPVLTSYELFRRVGVDPEAPFVSIGSWPIVYDEFGGIVEEVLEYMDIAVTLAETYTYYVVEYGYEGVELTSNQATVVTAPVPVIVPPVLSVTNLGNGTARLTWTAATGLPVDEYRLYRANAAAGPYVTPIYVGPLLTYDDPVGIDLTRYYVVDAIIDGDAFRSNEVSVTTTESDPQFSNVVLLVRASDVSINLSPIVLDVSSYARTLTKETAGGSFVCSNVNPKFGSFCYRNIGSGDVFSFLDDAAAELQAIATAKYWCHEGWINIQAGQVHAFLYKFTGSTLFPSIIQWNAPNRLRWRGDDNVNAYLMDDPDVTPNLQWVHLALVRYNDQFIAYINGIEKVRDVWNGNLANQFGGGRRWILGGTSGQILFDQIRWTMHASNPAAARYGTGNFTPPTRPFPNS